MKTLSPITAYRFVAVTFLALVLMAAAAPRAALAAPESFADLAEKLSPAVVNISTSHNANHLVFFYLHSLYFLNCFLG